nr:KTSC domain-containing protein [uncultured Flavobacterium sp.]
MKKTVENSSQVSEMEYNEQFNTLLVTYKPKMITYKYHKVPQSVANDLFIAESIGKHLNEHIKGKFDFEKV